MTYVLILSVLAACFEVVGLGFAAVGFRQTWVAHGQGQKFWDWKPFGAGVRDRLRRLLRRPGETDAGPVAGALPGPTGSFTAVVWDPPPDIRADPHGFATKVTQQLESAHRVAHTTSVGLAAETKAREQELASLRAELGYGIVEVEAATHAVAVEGLRPQVLGWFFLFVGLVLGSIATVIQAWAP